MSTLTLRSKIFTITIIGIAGVGCSNSITQAPTLSTEVTWSDECTPEPIKQTKSISNIFGEKIPTESLDTYIDQRMEKLKMAGISIAIINEGNVVFHRTKGVKNINSNEKLNGCSIFQGASITKPLFAYFVMTFVDDGSLNLDTPLYQYLPYPDIAHDERYKKITARMAINHQTGFPNWRTDYDKKNLFIQFEPGSDFHYSGEGYQYLSLVLQKIAGVDHSGLEKLFQERVAKPLSMRHTQVIPDTNLLSRMALPHNQKRQLVKVITSNSFEDFGAAYGVHSEALDFSKWLIALMNLKGLSEASFKEYFDTQKAPKKPALIERLKGLEGRSLGFSIFKLGDAKIYGHDGNNPGYSSLIAFNTEKKWGIVVFSNTNQRSKFGQDIIEFLHK